MDLLTTTAWKWQEALQAGDITSRALVTECMQQIEKYNRQLNAIISTAPLDGILAQAQRLDDERAASNLRSPLHGIPIVIKDVFVTSAAMGMPTTCGAAALAMATGSKNCFLVDRLLDAGLIILGKGNLTEFCGLRANMMRPGLSALGGQTQSPFIKGGLDEADTFFGNTHAGGSSSGPAVAVAAAFAPVAIGSETSGSLIAPANRAGLYCLKITPAKAETLCIGMSRLSRFYDSVGAVAKSARDLADITHILLGTQEARQPEKHTSTGLEGFQIGFVDSDLWRYSDDICYMAPAARTYLEHEYQKAIRHMAEAGASTLSDVELPDLSSLSIDGKSIVHTVSFSEIAGLMEEFLSSLQDCPVRNIDELIAWNKTRANWAMPEPCPDQEDLIRARKSAASLTKEEENQLFHTGVKKAYDFGVDKALRKHDLEFLVGPADSGLYVLAALAGCPIGTMPLTIVGFENCGKRSSRPDGLCILGRPGSDERILEFLVAYEKAFPFRPSPSEL